MAGARTLTPDRALSQAYPAGSVVVEIDQHTFSLAAQADGSFSLIRETAAGAFNRSSTVIGVAGRSTAHGDQVDIAVTVQAAAEPLRRVIDGSRVSNVDPSEERAMTPSTRLAPRQDARSGFASASSERGIAMIMVILVTTFLSALGLGLHCSRCSWIDSRPATWRARWRCSTPPMSAIEVAARDLAQIADWDEVLSGAQRSTFTDGTRRRRARPSGGGVVDLTAATNLLNCGRSANCTTAQMNANSRERPWGAQQPALAAVCVWADGANSRSLRGRAECYLAVWIADDGREEDGDPLADAAGEHQPGHGIVRVHAEVFGFAGRTASD